MKKSESTIRNIIFDMGNVLIVFDPDVYMDRAGISDPADRKLVMEKIYHSPLWIDMDLGILDEAEMCRIVKPELPAHLSGLAEELISGWCEPIVMVEGMAELVRELKDQGYGIYLLSNASIMQKKYWLDVTCSDLFDGVVVSAFEHTMKPYEQFYRILLDRYDLKASECVFIDDRQINLDGAKELGMAVCLFKGDVRILKDELKELLQT